MADPSGVPARFSDPAKFILHPTDFSPESERAFAHALRIALSNQARLVLLHVGGGSHAEWADFPHVRETLRRWGLLEAGAGRADVTKLGITVKKIDVLGSDVVDAVSGYTREHPVDLLILSTAGRTGLASWLRPSLAEKTARRMAVPTLFVPATARGCVAPEDGRVTMNQVLIPVDHQPAAGGAVERGLRRLAGFGSEQSRLVLLHVGPADAFPAVPLPAGTWPVVRTSRQGNPVTEILAAAEEGQADLIIMVTRGTEGFLDALRGTTTEQVLRRAPCPVLSVPADF